MKNKHYFLAVLFAVIFLATSSFSNQKDTPKQTYTNPYLKDWSDIGEFFASDYFYTPLSGTSKISADYFDIEILKHNKDTLQLGFSLERHINGGARERSWGNEGSCYRYNDDKDEYEEIKSIALLHPLSPTKAQILFPAFPQCTLMAQRDSQYLYINIEEQKTNKACAFLEQECSFDVREEYYITDKYYKLKAGFDCTKARSATEKSICSNPALANQDRMNNTLYFGTREWIKGMDLSDFTLPHSEEYIEISKLNSNLLIALQQKLDKQKSLILNKLLDIQRNCLKKRESCKGDEECIEEAMNEQFIDLGGYSYARFYDEINEALWEAFSSRAH